MPACTVWVKSRHLSLLCSLHKHAVKHSFMHSGLTFQIYSKFICMYQNWIWTICISVQFLHKHGASWHGAKHSFMHSELTFQTSSKFIGFQYLELNLNNMYVCICNSLLLSVICTSWIRMYHRICMYYVQVWRDIHDMRTMITLESSKIIDSALIFVYFIHSWEALFIILSFYWLKTRALPGHEPRQQFSSRISKTKSWKRDSQNFGIGNFEVNKNFATLSFEIVDLKEVRPSSIFIGKSIHLLPSLFRFCAYQIAVEVVKNFEIISFEIVDLKDKYKTASNNYFV